MERLDNLRRIEVDIEPFLRRAGEVFRRIEGHDSLCTSYGVEQGGRRFFVKHSDHPKALPALRRAVAVNSAVRHPALPRLWNVIETSAGGLALVYDWACGIVLNESAPLAAAGAVRDASSRERFRTLPADQIAAALDVIYDAHLHVAERGFVAVDFYDGSILYDFETGKLSLCDLDEYRPGAFVLEEDRLPGSTRFMAPEEFFRGSLIDQVTNVFTLGRAALVLMGNGTADAGAWRGSRETLEVVLRATRPRREERYQSVAEFVAAWRRAVSR